MKKVIVVLSPEAEMTYNNLQRMAIDSKTERIIFKGLSKKIALLKNDIHYGDPISKNLIPEEYLVKYNATNLFRVGLPAYWRMLYKLDNDPAEDAIVVLILDIIDHVIYDKKFGYKKL